MVASDCWRDTVGGVQRRRGRRHSHPDLSWWRTQLRGSCVRALVAVETRNNFVDRGEQGDGNLSRQPPSGAIRAVVQAGFWVGLIVGGVIAALIFGAGTNPALRRRAAA